MTQRFEFIEEMMRSAAKEHGVEVDENVLPKVARARMLMNVDMEHCPCDRENEGRGCCGPVCLEELRNGKPDKQGRIYCKCHCFYTEVKNDN